MQPIAIVLCISLGILIYISVDSVVNFGLKMTLMSKRKDSNQMITELNEKFHTDYRVYEQLPTETINIKSRDGYKLRGIYHEVHKNSKKVIIINHGYTANLYVCYQFVDVFIEEGYNLLLIDMRSHGESEGEIASYGLHESDDLHHWVKWSKQKIGKDVYIGLHGQSMGAATVMLYGGTHPDEIRFIIEDCGFTTAKEAIKFQFKLAKIPFWPLYHLIRLKIKRRYQFDLNQISPLESMTCSSVPTLFIHGTSDQIVPSWMAKALFEAKQGKNDALYLVPGANHMKAYSTDKETYKATIRSFLNQLSD